MTRKPPDNIGKSLQELRLLLTQTEVGMAEHVYPKLKVGHVWQIPDEISGFGDKDTHPWIVVRDFQNGQSSVMVSPRTTSVKSGKRGIVTPAGLLSGLDKEGVIVLKHRRSFSVEMFRDLTYLGCLPDTWIYKITDFYQREMKARTAHE